MVLSHIRADHYTMECTAAPTFVFLSPHMYILLFPHYMCPHQYQPNAAANAPNEV